MIATHDTGSCEDLAGLSEESLAVVDGDTGAAREGDPSDPAGGANTSARKARRSCV